MTELEHPFYLPLNEGKVMIGGKKPELITSDLVAGVARIGGFWRHPSYFESYLLAATLLIDQGKMTGKLDDICLPGFYLQRHALELMLKNLLDWLTAISDLRFELGRATFQPTNDFRAFTGRSHDLQRLLDNTLKICSELKLDAPPGELEALVHDMCSIETNATWSRYDSSHASKQKGDKSGGTLIRHIPGEIQIPIVEFQQRLTAVAHLISSRVFGGDTYEDELHDIWSELDATRDALK